MRSKSPARVGKIKSLKSSATFQYQRQVAAWLLAVLAISIVGFRCFRSSRDHPQHLRVLPFRRGRHVSASVSAGLIEQVTYIGIPEVDAALGCPSTTHGCFYQFIRDGAPLGQESRPPEHACHAVLRNCNRHGECIKRRDWCLRRGGVPRWLEARLPRWTWAREERPTYLFGRPDLDNPTHMACLHYLPLMKWMVAADLNPGQVLMLWDNVPSGGPGLYGAGLAAPLGETRWLPQLKGPITFSRIRFGEYGDLRFPYHLKKHEVALREDAEFQRLADLVKSGFGLDPTAAAQRPKVVVAKRRHTRVLANADELGAALSAAGMEATVVDFSALSFQQQVQTMADAAALVSVHGADCMNLMFLPVGGALVEIAPVHYGYGVRTVLRKGDYFNIARLMGKAHLEYVARSNATLLRNAQGDLVDWNHVNFVGQVEVDVANLLPVVEAAVMGACGACFQPCGSMDERGEEQCIPRQFLPRTSAT